MSSNRRTRQPATFDAHSRCMLAGLLESIGLSCHITSLLLYKKKLHMLGTVQAAWRMTELVSKDVCSIHSGCWLKCSRQYSRLAANTAPDMPEQRLCHRLQPRVSHCKACHKCALHACMHACIHHVHSPCAVQLDCHGRSLHSDGLQQAQAFKDACLLSAQPPRHQQKSGEALQSAA